MPSLHTYTAQTPLPHYPEPPHPLLAPGFVLWQPTWPNTTRFPLWLAASVPTDSYHLVISFETPMYLTCQDSAGILITCSNELQLAIIIADEHTLSVEALLSVSSDGWI